MMTPGEEQKFEFLKKRVLVLEHQLVKICDALVIDPGVDARIDYVKLLKEEARCTLID